MIVIRSMIVSTFPFSAPDTTTDTTKSYKEFNTCVNVNDKIERVASWQPCIYNYLGFFYSFYLPSLHSL